VEGRKGAGVAVRGPAGGTVLEISARDVLAAHRRIAGRIWPTPLMPADIGGGRPVHLKLECWQRTGSFKVRGAMNAMSLLDGEGRRRGVIAVSAGNHAQGVALAAAEAGTSALIVMPENASRVKVEAVRALGAEVRLVGRDYDEAELALPTVQAETGRALVHPFADPAVVAGQGTVGLEIALERPTVRQVVIPVGGGGLAVGSAIALKALLPGVRVYGVQTEASAPVVASYRAGGTCASPTVRRSPTASGATRRTRWWRCALRTSTVSSRSRRRRWPARCASSSASSASSRRVRAPRRSPRSGRACCLRTSRRRP